MFWARDYQGELVAATDPAQYLARLKCPICREPVFRKRGPLRTAHFSHYSLGGSWKCDLYYPSASDLVRRQHHTTSATSKGPDPNQRATLCLIDADRRYASLRLRLPVVVQADNEGVIELRSSFGVREIDCSTLGNTAFVAVPWGCPPAVCSSKGELPEVVREINDALAWLRSTNNIFKAAHGRGMLLDPLAPLELGGTYWLLSQNRLSTNAPLGLQVEESEGPRGWHKYKIDISSDGRSARGIELLEMYLARRVVVPSPRARIRTPIPHHYDPDGISVFGEDATCISIRWSGVARISLEGAGSANAQISNSVSDSDEYEIRNLQPGELLVLVDGVVHENARIADCAPFRPAGVLFRSQNVSCELFEPDANHMFHSNAAEKEIVVPAHRLWRIAAFNGKKLSLLPNGDNATLPPDVTAVDFGAFGWLAPLVAISKQEVIEVDVLMVHRRQRRMACIAGIAESHAGRAAAEEVLKADSVTFCLEWANRHSLAWLLPQLLNIIS